MENSIDLSPEQEIARFIQANYTLEHQSDLALAVGLLYQFEYEGIQETLCDLIYSPGGEDSDATSVTFSRIIEEALQDLIEKHDIKTSDATLANHLEIMRGIYHVQSVEDPIPFLRIIEGNTLSNEEKLAKILSQFSCYGEPYFLVLLMEVEDSFLSRLYLTLTEVEEIGTGDDVVNQELVDNFKLFIRRYGKTNLGYSIINMGVTLGLPVKTYLDYFTNHIDLSHPDTAAMDLLSFFFLASDTWQAPIEAYRQHNESLGANAKDLQSIEDKMQRIYESYTQFKKAHDDQVRLSPV